MAKKLQDPSKFAAELDAAVAQPQSVSEPEKRGKGRPPVDTKPLQLRLPKDVRQWLGQQSAKETAAEGQHVTFQTVILRVIRKEMANG
jgi:hypothetical protein